MRAPLLFALLATTAVSVNAQAQPTGPMVPALDPSWSPQSGAGSLKERPLPGGHAIAGSGGQTAGSASSGSGTQAAPPSYAGETAADVRDANSVPRALPPPIVTLSPNRPLTRKQSVQLSMVRRWRRHFVRPTLGADGWMHLIYGDGEPSIVCAPLHICTIALQPGEVVTSPPDVSDPRWIVHPRYTIDGNRKVINVILKPTDSGLDGTIVIATDRRVYSINLVSRTNEYMPLVRFDYADAPDDNADGGSGEWLGAAASGRAGSSDPCDATPIVPPASYRISGDAQPWKPVQVWSVATPVGEKTCVEFASDIGSRSLPALVALGHDGDWFSSPTPQIVNFRYVNRRFEIDEALDRFELISGVDSDQEKVVVSRIRHS